MPELNGRAGRASGFMIVVVTFTIASLLLSHASNLAADHGADPLASWNETGPKRAIIAFVEKATRQGDPGFIPAEDRIAVFDLDGTLLVEQPVPVAAVRRYPDLAYRPMVELLGYLRAHGFETWISSGSPVGLTRQFSEESFGIPPERVMGTSVQTKFAERGGRSVMVHGSSISSLNDKEGTPPTINLPIGRRPVFIGGNVRSNGDIAMMRYSKDRGGPSLQILINHDDSIREYAYAEKDGASLNAAARYGFIVVSMKNDWATVFSPGVSH